MPIKRRTGIEYSKYNTHDSRFGGCHLLFAHTAVFCIFGIMAVLIVYCLKDVPYDLKNAAVPKLLGVAATVISYRFKHNSLISLVSGTAVYMLMIRLI